MARQAASQKREYDIIFMDHMMPEMDGIEAAAAIRQIDGYTNTPIVVLTANALRGMKEWYLEKGFQDYLSKPINSEALDEIINKLLNNAKESARLSRVSLANGTEGNTHANFTAAIDEKRLNKLNHFNAGFQTGLEIDVEYYKRFSSLLESFDTLPENLQQDRAALLEAVQQKDAQKIRKTLPDFCEKIAAIYRREAEEGTENEITGEILQRLEKAIQDGDNNTAGKIVKEIGAKNLNPAERELYFKLYDSLMEDNLDKALEFIDHYRRTGK
jgi:CheY-like chemotaxis protein